MKGKRAQRRDGGRVPLARRLLARRGLKKRLGLAFALGPCRAAVWRKAQQSGVVRRSS